MKFDLIKTLQNGYKYSQVWPNKPQLFAIFPECRVISATKLALQLMPVIAVGSFILQLNYFGQNYLPQSLALSLLVLSLPMQGLIWLGKRSEQVLPVTLASWYYEIGDKLAENGVLIEQTKSKPKYLDMANTLSQAFNKLDKFWYKEWF
ncbi:terminus macrodomain insulation protein YfbV [Catenovulum maritimum]|uniref:UPF0208 membrane protein YfbV n=1 Tax=Catenovulum maritimum TaxID=1513271 RepID=A0A0J8GU27_9ALTE|nr:terminus macrodomain insulation protein YfbV [Catenovulum maritimum]KMT64193.1 hypothetical protein XM47_15605 [Catenovulum maritimum]